MSRSPPAHAAWHSVSSSSPSFMVKVETRYCGNPAVRPASGARISADQSASAKQVGRRVWDISVGRLQFNEKRVADRRDLLADKMPARFQFVGNLESPLSVAKPINLVGGGLLLHSGRVI